MKTTLTLLFVFIFSFAITSKSHAAVEYNDRTTESEYAEASEQQSANCTYSLSPTSASFGYGGGTGSFLVNTEPGCLVTAESNDAFIIITTGTGIGSTRIFYNVFSGNIERTGTIIINGQTFTVIQSASCNPVLSYNQSSFPAAGGTGNLAVTIGTDCHYTATSDTSFISFTNGTEIGTGSGIITFSILPNAGYIRQGSIAVNNVSLGFSQAGECAVSLTPNNASFSRAGGTGSFTVTVGANCPYTATTNSTFITINNGTGVGNGIVNFTVAPNAGLGRSGTIRLPGSISFAVTQFAGTVSSRAAFDFDGDYRSDISLFRPANGVWYILPSQSGSFYGFPFGQNGDLPAPADYDGDGKTDVAVFRPAVPGGGAQAYFYVLNSADNSFRAFSFGTQGDVPISGEWDGDGKADVAVYRGATTADGQSYFYYRPSSQPTVNFETIPLGTFGDIPIRADFVGDGRLDATVWQPSTGRWMIRGSGLSQTTQSTFGLATDIPVPADYDGDGRANIAVFRPSNGTWYVAGRTTSSFTSVQFGQNGDTPVPADYDGEGRVDLAVFRAGTWYVNRSTAGLIGFAFGASTDMPAPNAYIR